tara:strand:- start:433 stop:666 length:234 start_codon:yes stop_codon:yes gene_type:complete
MRELEIYRRELRHAAQRAAGNVASDEPALQADVDQSFVDSEALENSVEVCDCDIQGPGGGFYFIEGFSVVGGPDPVK